MKKFAKKKYIRLISSSFCPLPGIGCRSRNDYKRFKATIGKSLHIGESLRHIELKMTGKKDTSSKRVSYFRNIRDEDGLNF